MRIAVAASGGDTSSQVDERFGRAPWFLIVDTTTGDVEAIENAGAGEISGAGPKAAETIASREVDCLIVGHCGPNAFTALAAYGIDVVVGVSDTVAEAVRKLESGELRATGRPDVKGHWS